MSLIQAIKQVDRATGLMASVGAEIEKVEGENSDLTFRADCLYQDLLQLTTDLEDKSKSREEA